MIAIIDVPGTKLLYNLEVSFSVISWAIKSSTGFVPVCARWLGVNLHVEC
jgi:hypothetical protein